MMARRMWTQAEIERAQQLRATGMSLAKIGIELGRPGNNVDYNLKRAAGLLNQLGRKCLGCEAPLRDHAKGERCRRCTTIHMNADPEFQAKRIAALRASAALQSGSEQRRRAGRLSAQKRMANPFYVAWLRNLVKNVVQPCSQTPEARAKRDDVAAGKKISERKLGWCPLEYRGEYRRLIVSKGIKAAEARPIIMAQIKADRAKLETLSPFERQERALAKGAQLVANDIKPSLANPGVYRAEDAA